MGRSLPAALGLSRDKKKSGHGIRSYQRFVSSIDAAECSSNVELPPVIRLRPADRPGDRSAKSKSACRKSPCPVSKIHQAMARAPGVVARKIKGACSKVLGNGGSYLTDLFASNQLLMHFTAAPVSMHRKRQMYPTVGFRPTSSDSVTP